jgi:PhoH-like ATPase
MIKHYCVDTNILLDEENAIEILINGKDGGNTNVVYVPYTVLSELDGLKKDQKLCNRVSRAVDKLLEYKDQVKLLQKLADSSYGNKGKINDDRILEEIQLSNVDGIILVSNDKLLRFKAEKKGIKAEAFKYSNPWLSASQKYTGFVEESDAYISNSFFWREGKLHYNMSATSELAVAKIIDYENVLWTLKPKTPYQNALMELIKDPKVEVVSIQSEAGYGKTALSIAGAIELFMKEKEEDKSRKYKKIFIFRPNEEIGNKLGYLPGDVDEKMEVYFRPIKDLLEKLHDQKAIPKIWKDPKAQELEVNKKKLELLPINFLRGMNCSDCIVIIDEAQNLSRSEARTILSRMGQNVKVIITGDVQQIDNPYLNSDNNMLSWVVAKFKGSKNYGHIVLKGKNSRGPIADLVRTTGL